MDWRDENEAERSSWFGRLHLSWPMLLLAGWLLYEFTAQPGLAALVACAKFSWADVPTAFWLRRVDPDGGRGRTCFWAYLTYGLWKVAILAMLAVIPIGYLDVNFPGLLPGPAGNQRLPSMFNEIPAVVGQIIVLRGVRPVAVGVLTAAFIGFGLFLPLAYITLWSAWRNGVRIWLDSGPCRAYKERFWPPRHGQINMVPFIGIFQNFITWFVIVAIEVALEPIVQPKLHPAAGGLIMLLIFSVVACGLFWMWSRVVAHSPQECWVAEKGEQFYPIQDAEEGMGT